MTYTVNPEHRAARELRHATTSSPARPTSSTTALEQNLPDTLTQFYSLGFTTPGHAVAPSVSYNSDLSLEHHFQGTDMSFKLSPFLRQTQDQVENFYINYTTGITSGLNAGYQTSSRLRVRSSTRATSAATASPAQLSFAYTYATVKYSLLPNGTTVLSPINAGISQYNAYTKACAPGGSRLRQEAVRPAAVRLHDQRPGCRRRRATPRRHARLRRASPTTSPIRTGSRRRFRCSIPTASYLPVLDLSRTGRLGRQRVQLPVRRDAAAQLQARPLDGHAVVSVRGGQSLRRAAHDARHRSGRRLRQAAAGIDGRRPALSVRCRRRRTVRCQPQAAARQRCRFPIRTPDSSTRIGAFREPAQLLGHLQRRLRARRRASRVDGDAGQPAADVLRRTAHRVHVLLEQQTSARTPISSAARHRRRSATPTIPARTCKRSCGIPTSRTSEPTTTRPVRSTQPFNAYFSLKVKNLT